MFYRYLADLVVAVHVGYVTYVLAGQVLIWLGLALRWGFVRNPWFRWSHLVMMTIVGLEAAFGMTCPLTDWENRLRALAGQEVAGESFVGRLLHNLIFVDLPSPVIAGMHITFAVLVIATFVLAPPWRRSQTGPPDSSPPTVASAGSGTGF